MNLETRNAALEFAEMLEITGYKKGVQGFLRESAALGAALSMIVLYYGLFVAESGKIAALALAAFFLPAALNYFFRLYFFEARKKKIEEDVPDMLLLASSLPERTGVRQLVSFMASSGNGALSAEFRKAENEIIAGSSIEESFERMKLRNKSLALGRALDLLLNALRSGAEMSSAFRETAQDFMETNSILRERAANATIEKYTMLVAGGLIVPLVLGMLAGMISSFNFSSMADLGIGMGEAARKEIVESALLGNILYIAEYALIASAFVAFQEGNSKKAVLYASVLVPLSIGAYYAGKLVAG